MAAERPRILFVGVSATGHGGIQRFNRRVRDTLATLGLGALTIMTEDGRRVAIAAIVRAARHTDTLLLGHVNLLPLAVLFRLLRPGGRVILFAHGIEVWGNPVFRPVRRWEPLLLRQTVGRVAIVSLYSQARMIAAFGLPADRFVLFPNAVDPASNTTAADHAGHPTILSVARLGAGEREKHIDKLVRALPSLPGVRLLVIGDGALRAELHALAASLGVGERVTLPGAVDDRTLARAYAQATVFALPSTKEGFGIVYLEAWARGLPVVGADTGAAAEVIANGVDGVTVDPHDIPRLAAALRRLIADPALARAMGTAGRAKVARLYSPAAFAENLRALIAR